MDHEITQLLEREGVSAFFLAPMLAQKPLDELRAVRRYLNRQRNVDDRPKLFAWLVSRGFGAQLLSSRHQRRQRRQLATDDQKYLSGELAYLIQECPPSRPIPAPRHPMTQGQAQQSRQPHQALPSHAPRCADLGSIILGRRACSTSAPLARRHTPAMSRYHRMHVEVWSRVQTELAERVSPAEMAPWITPTTLAALAADQAFIETPHIFAREAVATTYWDTIAEVLQHVTGKYYVVEVVIGDGNNST